MPAESHRLPTTHPATHPATHPGGDPAKNLHPIQQQLVEVTEQIEHLTRAIQSRDQIGQAKGILMERYGITSEQAFDLLVAASTTSNSKLTAVAAHLTTTGLLERPPH
jgi:hypothetical protein